VRSHRRGSNGSGLCESGGELTIQARLIRLQWGFVANLVKVFPSLATRPLHLTGESFGETYIVSALARVESYASKVLISTDRRIS
jgi:carboxypeptidase D